MGHINDMDTMIIVCGPTATGKTALALSIAKRLGGELVSADSRQIYRGMDIGTGKDLKGKKTIDLLKEDILCDEEKYTLVPYDVGGIPLWMYDVIDPDGSFSVILYQYLARRIIDSILKRGNIPIIVGGTGLYIRSLLASFETAGVRPDMELRRRLNDVPLCTLQDMVKSENDGVWNRLTVSDRSNPRRLIRKLEIIRSGKPIQIRVDTKREHLQIGLTAPNSVLFQRIDARVDKRLDEGLLDEIQHLKNKGYDWTHPSFDALGYKEWREWFGNKEVQSDINKAAIIKKWKYDEHAYARRQMTWFKRDKHIRWFDVSRSDAVNCAMETAVTWYNTHR
jgi:tRNA dimethylallyltransferase